MLSFFNVTKVVNCLVFFFVCVNITSIVLYQFLIWVSNPVILHITLLKSTETTSTNFFRNSWPKCFWGSLLLVRTAEDKNAFVCYFLRVAASNFPVKSFTVCRRVSPSLYCILDPFILVIFHLWYNIQPLSFPGLLLTKTELVLET